MFNGFDSCIRKREILFLNLLLIKKMKRIIAAQVLGLVALTVGRNTEGGAASAVDDIRVPIDKISTDHGGNLVSA